MEENETANNNNQLNNPPEQAIARRSHRTVSPELITIIINSHNSGETVKSISRIVGRAKSTVRSVIKRYLDRGDATPIRPSVVRPKIFDASRLETLRSLLDQNATLTLARMQEILNTEHQIQTSRTTVYRAINEFHYSFKRIRNEPVARNEPENILARYHYATTWAAEVAPYEEAAIIYIDEAGFNVSMRPSYGRSLVGNRASIRVPAIRSRNISIICAINRNGLVHYESSSSAINRISFLSFLQGLRTQLNNIGVGRALLVLDNHRVHRVQEALQFCSENNMTLKMLPPYSPFLNPIEMAFSKWKNYVKRLLPNNEEELMAAIADGPSLITREDCNGFVSRAQSMFGMCIAQQAISDQP